MLTYRNPPLIHLNQAINVVTVNWSSHQAFNPRHLEVTNRQFGTL